MRLKDTEYWTDENILKTKQKNQLSNTTNNVIKHAHLARTTRPTKWDAFFNIINLIFGANQSFINDLDFTSDCALDFEKDGLAILIPAEVFSKKIHDILPIDYREVQTYDYEASSKFTLNDNDDGYQLNIVTKPYIYKIFIHNDDINNDAHNRKIIQPLAEKMEALTKKLTDPK